MALHSRFRAIRSSKSKRTTLLTATPDNRQFETDLGNGFVRVDNGAPPPGAPQSPAVPPSAPVVATEPTPIAKPVNHNTQPPDWRRDFGLGK